MGKLRDKRAVIELIVAFDEDATDADLDATFAVAEAAVWSTGAVPLGRGNIGWLVPTRAPLESGRELDPFDGEHSQVRWGNPQFGDDAA